jgi:hypothetical protein
MDLFELAPRKVKLVGHFGSRQSYRALELIPDLAEPTILVAIENFLDLRVQPFATRAAAPESGPVTGIAESGTTWPATRTPRSGTTARTAEAGSSSGRRTIAAHRPEGLDLLDLLVRQLKLRSDSGTQQEAHYRCPRRAPRAAHRGAVAMALGRRALLDAAGERHREYAERHREYAERHRSCC